MELAGLLDTSVPAPRNLAMVGWMAFVAVGLIANAGVALTMGPKAAGWLDEDSEAEQHVDLRIYRSDYPSDICRNGVGSRRI